MNQIGEKIYSGAAEYGKIKSGMNLFFGLLIGILFLVLGIFILKRKKVYTENIKGKIITSECTQEKDQNNKLIYNCNINVDYKVKDIEYIVDFSHKSSKQYKKDDQIDLYYDINDPKNVSLDKDENFFGWIFVGISLFVITWLVINFILTIRYKTYASVVGVEEAVGDVKNIFRN